MAIYNVHAGHSLICRGASGVLDETTEDRKVKNEVIRLLKLLGHTVYDCTDDIGVTANQNLSAIVKKCNAHKVDLDISIHLNAGRKDPNGDGYTGGSEVLAYNDDLKDLCSKMSAKIASALGIRDRGFKVRGDLYVLRKTVSKALLVECCFVDDKDDALKWDYIKCARAIVESITGKLPVENNAPQAAAPAAKKTVNTNITYRVYAGGKWWGEIKNFTDYSGVENKPITGLAMKVDNGSVKYRVHIKGGSWLPYVTAYNIKDHDKGYAGDLKNQIDAIEVYYYTPKGQNIKKAKYRVSTTSSTNYLGWQYDNETKNGMDGYAGVFGKPIDKVQIAIV